MNDQYKQQFLRFSKKSNSNIERSIHLKLENYSLVLVLKSNLSLFLAEHVIKNVIINFVIYVFSLACNNSVECSINSQTQILPFLPGLKVEFLQPSCSLAEPLQHQTKVSLDTVFIPNLKCFDLIRSHQTNSTPFTIVSNKSISGYSTFPQPFFIVQSMVCF